MRFFGFLCMCVLLFTVVPVIGQTLLERPRLTSTGPLAYKTITREALFDYAFAKDINDVVVTSFKARFGTQPTILIKGDRLNVEDKSVLLKIPKKKICSHIL